MAQKTPTLPPYGDLTLRQFLDLYDWSVDPDERLEGMAIALDFFQTQLDHQYLRQVITAFHKNPKRRRAPSPFAPHKPMIPVIKLVELMQAIDYREPVTVQKLLIGNPYSQFRHHDDREPRLDRLGNWFAHPNADPKALGLPGDQVRMWKVVVDREAYALKSRVADAFTWLPVRPNESNSERYFRGGGWQYFVAHPSEVFRLP